MVSIFEVGADLEGHINDTTVEIDGVEKQCILIDTLSIAGSPVRPFSRRWIYLAPEGKVVVKREIFKQGMDSQPNKGMTIIPWQRLAPKQRDALKRATEAQTQHFIALKSTLAR